jgi:4-hydroxymandelate oxidase
VTVEAGPGLVNVRDFEAAARARLDPVHYDYFASGAQDEITVAANASAFRRRTLIPRALRGASRPGSRRRCGTAGVHADPDRADGLPSPGVRRRRGGDGRAAADADVTMIAAMLSTVTIEEIAATGRTCGSSSTSSRTWPSRSRSCGGPRRPAAERWSSRWTRRRWAARAGRPQRLPRPAAGIICANMGGAGNVARWCSRRDLLVAPGLAPRTTALPILLKGVLHAADAWIAVDRGVDGLIVSNHGGRQPTPHRRRSTGSR